MKHALIIGASSGIGLCLATYLCDNGYRVTGVARHDCPDVRVQSYRADMAVQAEREAACAYVEAQDATPDVLIYCAATSICAPAQYTRDADMRYLWEVNYFGMVHMVQRLLPHLRAKHGQIVVVGSMASVAPIPFDAHYSASKSAIDAFCAVLAQELNPYDVHVWVALPGGTATGFSFKRLTYDADDCLEYYPEAQKSAYTLGKMEQTGMAPAEVAAAIGRRIEQRMGLYYPIGRNHVAYWLCKHLPETVTQNTIRLLYATDKT